MNTEGKYSMTNHFERYKDIKSNLIVGEENPDATPLVTIAIPTYKRPKYLKEAIDSALNQKDFHDYEVIVVDNDPDNESYTEKLISTYPKGKIKYYRNEKNIGMFGNWNRCIELSKGKWVSLLHDDDYLKDDFLATWHKVMQNNKSDYYSFGFENLDPGKKIERKRLKFLNSGLLKLIKKVLHFYEDGRNLKKTDLFFGNFVYGCLGLVIEKEKAMLCGGFNEDFYPRSDTAFWIQSFYKGISIYKHSKYKKVAMNRTEVSEGLRKTTILSMIDKQVDIARLIFGNKDNLINRLFKNISKDLYTLFFYVSGLISKSELKQKTTNITRSFIIFSLFKVYYFFYKLCLFIRK